MGGVTGSRSGNGSGGGGGSKYIFEVLKIYDGGLSMAGGDSVLIDM